MKQNTDSSKIDIDDIKTEKRKSGCETTKNPSTNIIDEDSVLIPVSSVSARSSSSATKPSAGNYQNVEISGTKPSSEFINKKDGIRGGMDVILKSYFMFLS